MEKSKTPSAPTCRKPTIGLQNTFGGEAHDLKGKEHPTRPLSTHAVRLHIVSTNTRSNTGLNAFHATTTIAISGHN